MSDSSVSREVNYILDIIRDIVGSGHSIDAAIEKVCSNPYAQPPAEVVEEARSRFLRETGKIAKYEGIDITNRKELEKGSWYSGPREEDHIYWPHVKQVLEPILGDALNDVDAASSVTLGSLRPPAESTINVRGLVLGYVQSGKTTNFISLIAKAADVGYRLIIVLAGLTDNLRKQTQARIDEQLISGTSGWIHLTDIESDFNKSKFLANHNNASSFFSNSDNRMIAVVKKNGHVLKALNQFLKNGGASTKELPILVIDDESDQASINVSPKAQSEVSRINAQIRELLRNSKTAYVAYTATPFANILIDPNEDQDIYPKDFIHVLPMPNGYFGAETIFGRAPLSGEEDIELDGLNMIRTIDESEVDQTRPPSKKNGGEAWDPSIPDSLDEAIRWFILATAARHARGQASKHSSMLVHTAVRTVAHEQLRDLIAEHVRILKSHYKKDNLRNELRKQWESEISTVPPEESKCKSLTFEEVDAYIPRVLDDIEVVMDNGISEHRLDYSTGRPLTVIAVGGNTLARGLTLEGLVSSYFVRTATAYDTLLQMGRWFGFRNGYGDLPRIWMTEELESWFQDLSLVEADLRRDLSRYTKENLTPMDFQARIRVHPSMEVTARAKQQDSRPASISYSGQKVQTILFRHKDKQWLESNIEATKRLVAEIKSAGVREIPKSNGTQVFRGISPSIIEEFLDNYTIYEESNLGKNDAALLKKYLKREHDTDSIRSWDVSFYGKSHKDDEETIDLGLGTNLPLVNRSQMIANSNPNVANIKALVGSMDRINTADIDSAARSQILKELSSTEGTTESRLLDAYEEHVGSDVGHLAIYAINPLSKTTQKRFSKSGKEIDIRNRRKDLDAVETIIGIGLFFPNSNNPDITADYVSAKEPIDAETMRLIQESEEEAFSNEFEDGDK
nr:Z1 domain-containing protein [Corynebacterium sp. UBA5992]